MRTYTYKQSQLGDTFCINMLLKCIFALLKNCGLITGEQKAVML